MPVAVVLPAASGSCADESGSPAGSAQIVQIWATFGDAGNALGTDCARVCYFRGLGSARWTRIFQIWGGLAVPTSSAELMFLDGCLYPLGEGGSEPLVDCQRFFQARRGLVWVAVLELAPADSFQGAGRLQRDVDVACYR